MRYKSLYENLGSITKQLPSKLYETEKGSKVDGNHSVGDVVTKEKSGKKKVCVFKAEEWRALPATKKDAEKLAKETVSKNEPTDSLKDKAEIKRLQDENLKLAADKEKAEKALMEMSKDKPIEGDKNNA